MGIPPLIQTNVAILINLLALSISGGLIVASLLTPRRSATSLSVAMFSFILGLSSLLSLMRIIPSLRFGLPSVTIEIAIVATCILIALNFLIFAYLFTGSSHIGKLIIPSLLLSFVGVVQAISGNMIESDIAPPHLTTNRLILLILIIIGLGLTTTLLIITPSWRARQLRWPAVCMIGAYLLNMNQLALELSLNTLLLIAVVVQSASFVLYHQWSRPLEEMREKMEHISQTLHLTFSELHRQKNAVENLHLELASAYHHRLDMLATMSHELRTPLNSIIGYSELLRSQLYGHLNEKQSDRLERIHRNGLQLADLINSILDLNNAESQNLKLDMAPISVPTLYNALEAHFQPLCNKKRLAFKVDIAPDLPPLIGDFHRLQQTMTNLLDNALKFTNEGSISLSAQVLVYPTDKDESERFGLIPALGDGIWVVLAVSDSGIGIPPEDQERIFNRFAKTSGARYSGIGLGLAIAAKLVQLQSGHIWVKSQVNKGSTFFVALPSTT